MGPIVEIRAPKEKKGYSRNITNKNSGALKQTQVNNTTGNQYSKNNPYLPTTQAQSDLKSGVL